MERSERTTLTVNRRPVELTVDPSVTLLHVLRTDLGLHGVRTGCGIGECGACTVLVDDAPVRSCITPLSEAAGRDVLTPEGLGTPDHPHPIQRAFLDAQAAQCGYCVNGIIMTVAGLERAGTAAADPCEALQTHLCRCGTHVRLIEAARRALGLPPEHREITVVEPDQAPPVAPMADDADLPAAIQANPRIEQWIDVQPDGTVTVYPGKVEIGQGIRTAFCQIVASQLAVPSDRIVIRSTRTGRSPDQWFTAGSLSIEDGGTALAHAAAACRRVLLERGASVLGVDVSDVILTPRGVETVGGDHVSLGSLTVDAPLDDEIRTSDRPSWHAAPLGQPVPRVDLVAKLTGAPAFLHDRVHPGTLHARLVLPPTPDARLERFDAERTRSLPGIVDVVRDGRIIAVLAEREDQAERAAERLRADLEWEHVPVEVPSFDIEAAYRAAPTDRFTSHEDDGAEELLGRESTYRASYSTPYQAHGPMASSVAIARADADQLQVWSHGQGVYPLRSELAALLDRPLESVVVEHVDGPGCYGMTAADDAAAFAALVAAAVPGHHVRLQLSIGDEFLWEPHGPAMFSDLEASLDAAGQVRAWRHHTLTDTHMARPNGSGDRLAAAWLREGGVPRPWPGAGEGGSRNTVPLYDVGALHAFADHVRGPLRTAALRCLGAYHNIFAAESFMDELAELAGQDPVAFRLAHLSDERARAVLELAADRAGWQPHVGPSGRGRGVALAHYKDSKAYVAQVAEVEVDPERGDLRVVRIVVACDAGLVVNPDGLRNQLEGGTLQGLSRALFEQLHVAPAGVREQDWTSYPVLRFGDVPRLDVHVLHRPDLPPLGVGESATPPVPAAVANAIDDAIGIRLRSLPLTADALQRRLLEMDDREAARVRI